MLNYDLRKCAADLDGATYIQQQGAKWQVMGKEEK